MTEKVDENMFWGLIKKVGKEVAMLGLKGYYVATAATTPAWAKAVMWSALAYFVCPIDAIPDVVPVVGFTDDVGALTGALGTCAAYVTDEIKKKAEDWFA
jgi:uncharacterized membrane protein YkvA (DUF1232 family)